MRYTSGLGIAREARSPTLPLASTEIEMFEAVRNNKRVAQIILAILIVPFAFFGMDAYFSDAPGGGEVASVKGQPIYMAEFDQALRDQQDRLRNAAGGQVDRALLESEELRRAVLDNLVNQRVLALYSMENRLVVTPQQLQETIAGIPAFQEDGQFSLSRYENVLRAQGMTPAMFEARLAQDARVQQVALSVGESGFAAKASSQRFLAAQLEERDVRELRFPASRHLAEVKLDEGAVKAYYEANAASFEKPARLKAEYVVFDDATLRAQITVTEDEIKAFYDGNAARFSQPEERQARHILIAVDADAGADAEAQAQARADELYARLQKNPKQFEALAREFSKDPGSASRGGDLGFFGRGMMVKPFEDAAFALAKGEIGAPVRSDFGFHIIQVADIRPARVRPFAEVRDEIAGELRAQAAGRRFAELADQFSNTVYEQADSLQPAADALKLQIRSSDWITRASEAVGDVRNAKLVEALFADDAVKNRSNTPAIEAGSNVLVAARVKEYEAAERLPLEAVQAEIETRLRAEAAAKLAVERGKAALAALQKGETVEGQFGEVRKLQRGTPALPGNAMQAVFSAATAKLPAYVGVEGGVDGGYAIYRIDAVTRPALPDTDPRVAAVGSQYERLMAERDFAAFIAELRRRYEVTTSLAPVRSE